MSVKIKKIKDLSLADLEKALGQEGKLSIHWGHVNYPTAKAGGLRKQALKSAKTDFKAVM